MIPVPDRVTTWITYCRSSHLYRQYIHDVILNKERRILFHQIYKALRTQGSVWEISHCGSECTHTLTSFPLPQLAINWWRHSLNQLFPYQHAACSASLYTGQWNEWGKKQCCSARTAVGPLSAATPQGGQTYLEEKANIDINILTQHLSQLWPLTTQFFDIIKSITLTF